MRYDAAVPTGRRSGVAIGGGGNDRHKEARDGCRDQRRQPFGVVKWLLHKEERPMDSLTTPDKPIPWWKEPTRDQWYAFVAAWLGWTLDAFDFTVFLLIMHPIAETFHVSMTAVTFVFTITLWMRLLGATASGWFGDRLGRKKPLMIAILGYSLCDFAAGFSPTFLFLFVARAILGLFMGAEWRPGRHWPWRPGRSARAA
jgi:hypothetical protein